MQTLAHPQEPSSQFQPPTKEKTRVTTTPHLIHFSLQTKPEPFSLGNPFASYYMGNKLHFTPINAWEGACPASKNVRGPNKTSCCAYCLKTTKGLLYFYTSKTTHQPPLLGGKRGHTNKFLKKNFPEVFHKIPLHFSCHRPLLAARESGKARPHFFSLSSRGQARVKGLGIVSSMGVMKKIKFIEHLPWFLFSKYFYMYITYII